MASQLEGKVAVVTGAAGGLGAASALRLSREGCSVVVDFHHLNAGIPGSLGNFTGPREA
jgi:NAD(P)-dependent dehydrogenase (short-subunit alcohol dehydrogenase family)